MSETDLTVLQVWIKKAARASSIDDFMQRIEE